MNREAAAVRLDDAPRGVEPEAGLLGVATQRIA